MHSYQLPDAWEHAVAGWLDWMTAAGMSTATVTLRRSLVRSVARQLGTIHPTAVTGQQLVSLCATGHWSNEYRRSLRNALIGFYDWLIRAGATTDNPARALPRVRESAPQPRPVTDNIWHNLLMQATERERLMARLGAEAGLRRAEIARVRTDDLTADLLGWSLIVRGKGNKQRVVPLTDDLASAIRGHGESGYLFCGGDGTGHLSPQRVGALLSRLMPPGWSAHKLRHRYASRGFAATRNLLAVQQALGHASVATTQRYVAVSSAEVRAVSEAAA